MMMDENAAGLSLTFRRMWLVWGILVLVSAGLWFFWGQGRPYTEGLLLGQMGGAYVMYSMIRQGHLRDGLQGKPLLLSGMLGMFTRFAVLVAVMLIAIKTPSVSPYAALAGYLLGMVIVISGLILHERSK